MSSGSLKILENRMLRKYFDKRRSVRKTEKIA
jgi:hypothetical protein